VWKSSITVRHFLRAARYKSFSVVILVYYLITEQNSIDIIVKNENLINAVQNEPSVWNTKLNSSEEEKVTLLRSGQWGSWTRASLLTC